MRSIYYQALNVENMEAINFQVYLEIFLRVKVLSNKDLFQDGEVSLMIYNLSIVSCQMITQVILLYTHNIKTTHYQMDK